jgi:putative membrane protein
MGLAGTPFAHVATNVRSVVLTMRARSAGRAGLVATAVLFVAARPALAHPGRAPEPHDLWSAWTLAPAVLGGCLLAAWLYARGLRALRRRAGHGRVVPAWRGWCYAAAWLALLVALVSPLDAVSAALFSAHMLQHLLLVMVAAPVFLLGDPMMTSVWALPLGWRRAVGAWWRRTPAVRAAWRVLTAPLVAWTLHVAALWAWHLPTLYDCALSSERVHVLEHAIFFLTALLFWWPILRPHGRRLPTMTAVFYLFAAAMQGTLLGAVLALARHPLYAAHFGTTRAWGLTPLEDQQLAGLLMWVPAGFVYLAALVPPVLRALRETTGQRARSSLAIAGVSARGTP